MSIQRETREPSILAEQAQAPQGVRRSFLNIGTPGGLSRTQTSEALVRATTAFEKALKLLKPSSQLRVEMLKLDNTRQTSLHLSSVVLYSLPADNSIKDLTFHVMLLEGSGEPLANTQAQFGNQQVPVRRYTEEVLNDLYLQTVVEVLGSEFPGYTLHNASGCVVPRAFNWEDTDAVSALLNNGSWAVVNKLLTRLQPEETRINLTEFGQDAVLQLTPTFRHPDTQDHLGNPVRSDCFMSLVAMPVNRAKADVPNAGERPVALANICGFTDLVWAPPQNGYTTPFGGQGPNWKFAARQVLTVLENVRYNTIEAQLLALAAAYRLNENNTWYMGFVSSTSQFRKGTVNLKDIGALNIEANVHNEPSGFGTAADTNSATWTPLELGKFLNAAVRPGLSVAIDVSTLGTDTWFNEVFSAASLGDVMAQRAILEAADNLTGGHFSTRYKSSAAPFAVIEETVLMGTYRKADGTLGDLRDFDHLAVLNLVGATDPTIGAQWSDTFLRTDHSKERRLDARANLLNSLESTAVITGTAQRCTAIGDFMKALVDSITDAGQYLRLGASSDVQFQNTRGVASWVEQTHMAPAVSGLFRAGGQTRTADVNANRFSGRAW